MSQNNRFTNLGDGVYRQFNSWQIKGTSQGKYDMALENAQWDKTGVDPRTDRTDRAGYVSIDIDDSAIRRASLVLAGVSNGFYAAVGSAIRRAAEHGRTVGMKIASQRYTAGVNVMKRYMQISTSTGSKSNYGDGDGVSVYYRGFLIPLINFDTRASKDGRVTTRVMQSSTQKTLNHAFISHAMGNAKAGVFTRIGPGRYPIRGLYGPSPVHALFADEEASQRAGEAIEESFDANIDHEITRVLNGWGG